MKFISKLPKLRIVLKPGLPGNRQLGTASVSMLSVLFENGVAEVNDKEKIEMMLAHQDCNRMFFPVEEGEKDFFAGKRVELEPKHKTTEINYGQMGKSVNVKNPTPLNVEQMDLVKKLATDMATELFKKMVEENKGSADVAKEASPTEVSPDKAPVPEKDPLENFSSLAPEPQEDTGDTIRVSEEPTVAPKIDLDNKAETQAVEEVKEDNKPKRGRPAYSNK